MSPGARFDARYEIVRPLGEGGMGAVFEVKRVTDGQSLALKIVTGPISRANTQRFAREAEIGARLRHPNLVPIVDVGIAAHGAPFLVMELIKGTSLEEHRDRFGDETWARPILLQIARGLSALHAAKVVHRDLKPGNVLLSGDEPSLARIADFGISRLNEVAVDGCAATAAKLTGTNAMLGTPFYMAPELAHGRAADTATDIFAFGIVAYEMLTGRGPFAMPPVIVAMAGHELPPPAAIACEVVLRCMCSDPRARPAAQELVDALSA
jgi:serine/threonine-protein kinase